MFRSKDGTVEIMGRFRQVCFVQFQYQEKPFTIEYTGKSVRIDNRPGSRRESYNTRDTWAEFDSGLMNRARDHVEILTEMAPGCFAWSHAEEEDSHRGSYRSSMEIHFDLNRMEARMSWSTHSDCSS